MFLFRSAEALELNIIDKLSSFIEDLWIPAFAGMTRGKRE